MADDTTADELIRRLRLEPHPEGGWYRQTWLGPDGTDGRAIGTSILFLLRADERSHWHRVDATEIWHHHAGAPVELSTAPAEPDGTGEVVVHTIGDAADGHDPMAVVPAHAWQSATPVGGWSLVGCTVTPGFRFEGFELAPPGWAP